MADQTDSQTVKAGSRTYFFDRKESKDRRPFLVITESRFVGEGKECERASIVVFPDHARLHRRLYNSPTSCPKMRRAMATAAA